MSERVYTFDEVHSALCIMEEILDPQLKDAEHPWQPYREQWGIDGLREAVITNLAHAASKAWDRATLKYQQLHDTWEQRRHDAERIDKPFFDDPPQDLGSFDYEFLPVWLRECVDWSDLNAGPRVRGSST